MPLLLRPPPLPDEWIGSWIVRLAEANYAPMPMNSRRLLNTLGIDAVEVRLTDDHLDFLSTATGVSLTILQILNSLPTDLMQHTGRSGSSLALPTPFLGVRYLVVCPDCLEGDQEPYFRRSWLSRSTLACPTHGGPLYDGCPHCDARIGVPMTSLESFRRRRVPKGVQHRRENDLRQCWNCRGDLAVQHSSLEPLLPGAETVPHQFDADVVSDPQVWAAFVRGLRAYLHTYDLPQLVDPGHVRLSLVPSPLLSSLTSVDARFRTERILVWLLTPMTDRVMHPHRRLQLMAGTVLGLLSATLGPESSRRWLHVAWLSTRLLQEPARTVLSVWPDQVSALVSLFEERRADPRPAADPTFQLHDEPWQVMAPLLISALAVKPPRNQPGSFLTLAESRATMDAVLQNLAGASWRDISQTGLEPTRVRAWLSFWKEDGRLGLALGQLHRALLSHRTRLLKRSKNEPVWVEQAVAVLMTDRALELTRTVNPALHRELLLELIRALEHQKS